MTNLERKLDLLTIGEAMAEIRKGDDHTRGSQFVVGFAGDAYNAAVYCKRAMGPSSWIGFFTRVGQDPLSAEFVASVEREGIDPSFIALDQERNIGIYSVLTDETGERSFSYWRDSSAARLLFSQDEAVYHLPEAKVYYLTGITLAILSPPARRRLLEHLSLLSKAGDALIAFDSNYRPKLWESRRIARQVITEMWSIADIALPSIDDEMDLFGDSSEDAVVQRFAKRDWHASAIKRGMRGPLSLNLSGDQLPNFPPASRVVDTTAAGDSFNGGYLAALLQGKDEAACLINGHAVASKVVAKPGAIVAEE